MLKSVNIQAALLGHGHANKLNDFNGIPGIMGRSNLRASKLVGGYNIGTIKEDTLYYAERITGQITKPAWCKVPLGKRSFREVPETKAGFIPLNSGVQPVRINWEFQEKSDIGTGIARSGNICVYAGTNGEIVARDTRNGSIIWKFKTGDKIYSTPAVQGNRVVCPSTDKNIYCLDLKNGHLLWTFESNRSIVASPVIGHNRVFNGSSEGIFRAIDLRTGKLVWQWDSVRNFVETKPLLYKKAVYFGSWGNAFYALDQSSGKLLWKREKYSNRMLSPAAVWPVAARGRIFIVAPDRRMTALSARSGKEDWDSGKYSCRESIGISDDGKLVYIKNMTEGNVDAFFTKSGSQQLAWECKANLGYEIAPSPITEKGNLVFIPTTSGFIYAINKVTSQVEWKFRVSEALVNYILPFGDKQLLVTTLDGKVACLAY